MHFESKVIAVPSPTHLNTKYFVQTDSFRFQFLGASTSAIIIEFAIRMGHAQRRECVSYPKLSSRTLLPHHSGPDAYNNGDCTFYNANATRIASKNGDNIRSGKAIDQNDFATASESIELSGRVHRTTTIYVTRRSKLIVPMQNGNAIQFHLQTETELLADHIYY